MVGFDDRLEDEDYDLIAENTGIQIKRKKFRRVHGNLLDSDDDEAANEAGRPEMATAKSAGGGDTSGALDDSLDSMQDEDFAHVCVYV